MRRYERVSFLGPLEIKNLDTGLSFRCQGIDLSRTGVGFFCRQFIPAGTLIVLTITMDKGRLKGTARVNATVVQARIEGGGAVMGAAFDSVLHPAAQPLLCSYLDRQ